MTKNTFCKYHRQIATLQKTSAAINALATPPAFVVHTGDITHLSKPEEFDLAKQLMSQLKSDSIRSISSLAKIPKSATALWGNPNS
jgi:3',5'-cyclic AMP phosphodiesterase CpdA